MCLYNLFGRERASARECGNCFLIQKLQFTDYGHRSARIADHVRLKAIADPVAPSVPPTPAPVQRALRGLASPTAAAPKWYPGAAVLP